MVIKTETVPGVFFRKIFVTLMLQIYCDLKNVCYFLLAFTIFSSPLYAQETPTPSTKKVMKEIHLSVGFSVPPYVIAGENRGAELDIVREAMALEGYRVVPFYVSNKRRNAEFMDGITDGAMTVSPHEELEGHFSKTYITYQNVAISLADRQFDVKKIADLRGKRIVAFQTASKVLGPDFAHTVSGNSTYREVAKQYEQIIRLYAGDTDFVVGDKNILRWFVKNSEYPDTLDTNQPIAVHQIFLPGHKYAVFRNRSLTIAFDRGIDTLKENGRYDAILTSYGFNVLPQNDPS
ncbi:substrate-binding periplasmic protein [Kiloniella sp.]|uniref:substrate-binding periplasmic protein n=1 Tax=Kiloniella sp. TaxID=1938587 RepID=UPI003B0128C9